MSRLAILMGSMLMLVTGKITVDDIVLHFVRLFLCTLPTVTYVKTYTVTNMHRH